MRLTAALLAGGVILVGCAASYAGTTASSPSPSANVSVEPTRTPGTDGRFAPDQIAAVVTSDLVVRSTPGTGDESEIYPGRYDVPMAVFVIDGPVFADGYEWYLVEAVRGQTIGEYPQPGWVAAAGLDGEPWLGPDSFTCRSPAAADLLDLEPQRALACYRDTTLTVEGTLTGCEPSVAYGSQAWATHCGLVRLGFDVRATPDPGCFDCFEPALGLYFNGDIGLANLAAGTEIRVQGHFDDPAAATCTQDDGVHGLPALRVHACRMTFVATDMEIIAS